MCLTSDHKTMTSTYVYSGAGVAIDYLTTLKLFGVFPSWNSLIRKLREEAEVIRGAALAEGYPPDAPPSFCCSVGELAVVLGKSETAPEEDGPDDTVIVMLDMDGGEAYAFIPSTYACYEVGEDASKRALPSLSEQLAVGVLGPVEYFMASTGRPSEGLYEYYVRGLHSRRNLIEAKARAAFRDVMAVIVARA